MNYQHIQSPFLFHGCLHFTFKRKKYLYGLTQTLFQDQIIIQRFNGNLKYKQSTHTIKEGNKKSTIALTRQKNLLKIDYVVLPSKACKFAYAWYFQQLQKLKCKHFLAFDQTTKINSKNIYAKLVKQSKITPQTFQSFQNHVKQVLYSSEVYGNIQKNQVQSKYVRKGMMHAQIRQQQEKIGQLSKQNTNERLKPLSQKDSTDQQTLLLKIIDELYAKELQQKYQQLEIKWQKILQAYPSYSQSYQTLPYFPTLYHEMIIFTPQNTQSIFCFNRSSVLIVDPFEMTSKFLQKLNIPVYAVNTIVLTQFSINFVDFLIKLHPYQENKPQWKIFLNILTLDVIQEKIRRILKQTFEWNSEMINNRISFKIIRTGKHKKINQNLTQQKKQKFVVQNYKVSFQQGINKIWTFYFGQKIFKVYSNQLKVSLTQNEFKNAQLIFLTSFSQQTKKYLKQLPNFLQRKIVHLRKYKHKYFYSLTYQNPMIHIQSQVFKDARFKDRLLSVPYDQSIYTLVKLKHGEEVNCYDRRVIVLDGIGVANFTKNKVFNNKQISKQTQYKKIALFNSFMTIYGNFVPLEEFALDNLKYFQSLKYTTILVQEKQISKLYKRSQIQPQKWIKFQNLQLFKAKTNIAVQMMSRYRTNFRHSLIITKSQEQSPQYQPQQVQLVQMQSPLYLFSKIFISKTYESGSIINQKNENVYFITKGLMKWKSNNDKRRAENNYFIGCLSFDSFQKNGSNQKKSQLKEVQFSIQVIKDSWVLQAGRKSFFFFMNKHPQVYDYFLGKGDIFIR